MMRAHSGVLYSLRYELFGLAALAAMTVSSSPADARHHSGGTAHSTHVDSSFGLLVGFKVIADEVILAHSAGAAREPGSQTDDRGNFLKKYGG
jgi:hypothetical protein